MNENDKLLRGLKCLDGHLKKAIVQIGCGGDGSIWLHELEKDGTLIKVAVKSATKKDPIWAKY